MDLKSQSVSGKKINSKNISSKHHLESSSLIGPSTLRCCDIQTHTSALERRLNSKPNQELVSKTIQKCSGLELASQPALPEAVFGLESASQPALTVAVSKSQSVSTALGTPVILYPADSFPSADSSLASLSSLIQNIVCNSHGAIMKPLSSAHGCSSSTSPSELVTPSLQVNANGALRGSASAAVPVLTNQLSAGKPILIPFHISHMNYLNEVTKYKCVSSNIMPKSTSILKPLGTSQSQPIQQRPLSQLYHAWSSATHKKCPASAGAINLHNTSTVSDINIFNSNDIKINDQLLLKSSPGSPCLEAKYCPKSEAIKDQPILPEKTSLNSEFKASIFSSNCFLPNSSTKIILASDNDYVPSENLVTKNPRTKILTSLLSNKTKNHSKSLLVAENPHDSQTIGNEAKLDDACSAHTLLPSPTGASSIQDSETLQQSMAKKKRFDKSRIRLACSNCDLLFYSGTDLLVHRYEQHSHVCGECDGRFLSVARLKQHKESDHPAIMICSHCRFHTFDKQWLIDHQRLEHILEIDSAGDNKTTSKEISKCNMNLSMDKPSSQMQVICNVRISSPSGNNNRSDRPTSINESVGLSAVSVNISNSTDTYKDCKQGTSSRALSVTSESGLEANGPIFALYGNEQFLKESLDSTSSYANFKYCEQCRLDIVDSADQQLSESDEPKLVIDTDKCRNIRDAGHERRTRRKEAHSETKLEICPCECQANVEINKWCSKDRKKQNPPNTLPLHEAETDFLQDNHYKDHNGINDGVNLNKEIRDSTVIANEPMDFLIPDDSREMLEVNLKPDILMARQNITINSKRTKSANSSPSDDHSKNLETKLGSEERNGEYVNLNKAVSSQYHFGARKVCATSKATCSGNSPKQAEVRSHSSESESKLHPLTSHLFADSLSSSRAMTVGVESLSGGQATKHLLAPKEKFVPLLERHALNSLPPKKRKTFFRCCKSDTVVPQLADSYQRSTGAFQQDIRSLKIKENDFQCTQSNTETVASTLGRTLSNKCFESLQLGQSTDRRYLCPVSNCLASFSRKWNLDGHINRVHAKLVSVTCSVAGCQKTFPSKRDLRQHVTIDHKGKSRKYKCCWPECNKSFFARTHLRIHNLTHTGEKPVACSVCDYRCRQRTALMWHMRKHGIFDKS